MKKVMRLKKLLSSFYLFFFLPSTFTFSYILYEKDNGLGVQLYINLLLAEFIGLLIMSYITLIVGELEESLQEEIIWFTAREMRFMILQFQFQLMLVVSGGFVALYLDSFRLHFGLIMFCIMFNLLMVFRLITLTKVSFFQKERLMGSGGIVVQTLDLCLDNYGYLLLPYFGAVLIGANFILYFIKAHGTFILLISVGWFFLVLMCLALRIQELKSSSRDKVFFNFVTISFIKRSVIGLFIMIFSGGLIEVYCFLVGPRLFFGLVFKVLLLGYVGFISICLLIKLKKDELAVKEYFPGSFVKLLDLKEWLNIKNLLISIVLFIFLVFSLGFIFYLFSGYLRLLSYKKITLELFDIIQKDKLDKVKGCQGCDHYKGVLDDFHSNIDQDVIERMESGVKFCKEGDIIFSCRDGEVSGWYQVELIITEEEFKLYPRKYRKYHKFINLDNGRVALLKRYSEVNKF